MIQPNFDLMMWVIFIALALKAIVQIISGAIGDEKPKKYDGGDIFAGIVWLIILSFIIFT